MDSREIVGWVLLAVVATLFFLFSNGFVSAVEREIAQGSVPLTGSWLSSADEAALSRFRLLGQAGRGITGALLLAALLGGAFRAVRRRSSSPA